MEKALRFLLLYPKTNCKRSLPKTPESNATRSNHLLFGFGDYLESITIGLIMSCLILIFGTCYSKFIEERELWIRFGQEYEEYKEKTPFLVLRF